MNISKILNLSYKKDHILELHFNTKQKKTGYNEISFNQYHSLLNILSDDNSMLFKVNRLYYDDEDINVIKEEIAPTTETEIKSQPTLGLLGKQQLYYSKFKQVSLIDTKNLGKYSQIILSQESPISEEITELYDVGLLEEKSNYKALSYLIILEPGIQAYLSKVETVSIDNINNQEEYYTFVINFNTKILKKQSLEPKIEKYVRKIGFYLNLENIMRNKISNLFNKKHYLVPELNRVLNKPTTLERDYMSSLSTNYTVTDKADGERHLLVIDKYSTGILINNKFQIKAIMEKPIKDVSNCILDGEYISMPYPTATKSNSHFDKFMIFDILEYEGKSMVEKTFMERLSKMNKLVTIKCGCGLIHPMLFKKNKKLQIKMKHFYMLEDYLFLSNDKIGINTLPKGETFQDVVKYPFLSVLKKSKFQEIINDLWINQKQHFSHLLDGLILTPLDGLYSLDKKPKPVIYKWKDIHTVDVRITENPSNDLKWNFDVNRNEKSSPDIIEDFSYDEKKDTNGTSVPLTEGDIIELMCSKKQNQFIPIRIRDDKVIPNARKTFESVVQAIEDDITVEELTNKISKTEFNINFGEAFYQEKNPNKKEREQSIDINMKNFHNYIKTKLIEYPDDGTRGITLLDLSAGKGGDIHKIRHAGYKEILACDISATALTEYSKRISKLKKQKKLKDVNITLINTDSTKSITNGEAGLTSEDEQRLKDYFTIHHPAMKFSKIISNFAISYMFSEDYMATGFMNNIANCLSNDKDNGETGYFVGTFIDGDLLDEIFIDKKENELIAKIGNSVFYTIKPIGEYVKKGKDNRIMVSRPGGWDQAIPEPVVYTSQIKAALKKVGINKFKTTPFSEYYESFLIEDKKNKKLKKGEETISFLHKTFIATW